MGVKRYWMGKEENYSIVGTEQLVLKQNFRTNANFERGERRGGYERENKLKKITSFITGERVVGKSKGPQN